MKTAELRHFLAVQCIAFTEIFVRNRAAFRRKITSELCICNGKPPFSVLTGEEIDHPASGQLLWDNTPVTDLSAYRRNVVSIISQSYLLFPTRTVLENVCYPLHLEKKPRNEAAEEAKQLLQSVGIDDKLYDRLPEKLSGGEQQRVAIARCLATNSKIIAADEPTGNLDEENTQIIVKLLQRLAHENKKTVIVVTHDPAVAQMADKQLQLAAGNLIDE